MRLKHPDIPELSTCTGSLSSLRPRDKQHGGEKKTGSEIPPPLLIKPQSSEYV